MSRSLIVTVVVLLLIIGAYSGYWAFQANHMKNEVKNHIEQLNLKSKGPTLNYSKLESIGFPFKIGARLIDPVVKSTDVGSADTILTTKTFDIISDLLYKKIELKTAGEINIETKLGSEIFKNKMKFDPRVEMHFSESLIKPLPTSDLTTDPRKDVKEFWKGAFQKFIYKDDGFSKLDENGTVLLESKNPSSLEIQKLFSEGDRIKLKIVTKLSNISDLLNSGTDKTKDSGTKTATQDMSADSIKNETKAFVLNSDFVAEMDKSDSKDSYKFQIANLYLKFTNFGFLMKGDLNFDLSKHSDLFPIGKLDIIFENFEKFSSLLQGMADSSTGFDSKIATFLKTEIPLASNETLNDGRDLLLVYSREPDAQQANFGVKTFTELVSDFSFYTLRGEKPALHTETQLPKAAEPSLSLDPAASIEDSPLMQPDLESFDSNLVSQP